MTNDNTCQTCNITQKSFENDFNHCDICGHILCPKCYHLTCFIQYKCLDCSEQKATTSCSLCSDIMCAECKADMDDKCGDCHYRHKYCIAAWCFTDETDSCTTECPELDTEIADCDCTNCKPHKCPNCNIKTKYTKTANLNDKPTHIWSCPECPLVMLEYYDKWDLFALKKYLTQ